VHEDAATTDLSVAPVEYDETEYDKIVENPEEHDDWDDFDDPLLNKETDAISTHSSATLESIPNSKPTKRGIDEVDTDSLEQGSPAAIAERASPSTDSKRTRTS